MWKTEELSFVLPDVELAPSRQIKADSRPEKVSIMSKRADTRARMADFSQGEPMKRSMTAIFMLGRNDVRLDSSDRADLRPERIN